MKFPKVLAELRLVVLVSTSREASAAIVTDTVVVPVPANCA
ncbi:MAG: hypothetical protein ABSH56_30795 [Bryobacteraceae bacterium]